MKTPIKNEVVDLSVGNKMVQAVICPSCGTKIYPAEVLEVHMQQHQRKENTLQEELRKLQAAMVRMRLN